MDVGKPTGTRDLDLQLWILKSVQESRSEYLIRDHQFISAGIYSPGRLCALCRNRGDRILQLHINQGKFTSSIVGAPSASSHISSAVHL